MSENSQALSVSAALNIAKAQLESITVKVIGEVSELSDKAGYKAVYFTIKDKSSSMPCMMWNNRYKALGFKLEIGAMVEITGRFSLYAAKGRMNFDVFKIELAGEGNLRMQVANLAKKLEAEGLMHPSRKRPLPKLPSKIGLVTSPRGAAVYDVLRTLRRRYPIADVVFAGVGVEGANASADMIEALKAVEQAGAEVILLVRGGGSFEDLMPFNDESLARYIANVGVPVVTGIGHEPDTSIADMVADLRASTPTAAAEAVSTALDEMFAQLRETSVRMFSAQQRRVSSFRQSLLKLESTPLFTDPMRILQNVAQGIDSLAQRLSSAIPSVVERRIAAVKLLQLKMIQRGDALKAYGRSELSSATQSLSNSGKNLLSPYKAKLGKAAGKLEGLSPLGAIERGYSMASTKAGKIITKIDEVELDDEIDIRISDGVLGCKVESKEHTDQAS